MRRLLRWAGLLPSGPAQRKLRSGSGTAACQQIRSASAKCQLHSSVQFMSPFTSAGVYKAPAVRLCLGVLLWGWGNR